ncbi:serine/threonine-protein phosphatase CPPED1-like isoform X2 [Antedon mediterranea]
MINSYVDRGDGSKWDKERKLTRRAIDAANNMHPKPKFFIVCGDLVDSFPGTSSDDKVKKEQIQDFKIDFKTLDSNIPLICVCGNHDVGNSPTQDSVEKYKESFGDDYFSFWVGGVKFLVLNSQYYKDSSQVPEQKEEQDVWLETQLQNDGWQHLVVFHHIPWFLESPDEEDQYFNIDIDVRKTMLKRFHDAGVKKIFCGHYHRNAGGFDEDLEVVVTSAVGCQMGEDKSGFRVVTVKETEIQHKYYDLGQVPKNIDLE